MPKTTDKRLLTPSGIRITLSSTLQGVNVCVTAGPSSSDPLGSSCMTKPCADLSAALESIPDLVCQEIARVEDRDQLVEMREALVKVGFEDYTGD